MRFAKFFTATAFIALATSGFEARAMHTYAGVDLRNGAETSLIRDDVSKKGTVLVFLSSKCPCSASHMTEIKDLANDFPEFRFIGVNSNADETFESAKSFFGAQSFSFPILRDEKLKIADEFKAVKTPHAFILASDGRKIFQGGVSNSATFPRADRKYLREALEDLKADRTVRTPLARALGCAISRGE